MNDVQTLLAKCRELGAEFTSTPDGKLKVRAPAPLPETLQAELKQHKAEVLALLSQRQEPASWPCPHCGRTAEIEAVEPRQLDGVLLTYWNCQRCQVWAVTPATLREPPSGWVSKREQ